MATIEEKRKALLEQKLKEMADMGVTKRAPEEYPSFDQPFQVMSANEVEDSPSIPDEVQQDKEQDTVKMETQPPKSISRKAKTVQKNDFAEYQQRFLTPAMFEHRTQFAMNKETVEQLRHIIQDLAIKITLTAYIENILRDHISEYRDLINQVTAKRRRKETIPE